MVTGAFVPDLDPTVDGCHTMQYSYNSTQYSLELYDECFVSYDGHLNRWLLNRCDCMIIVVDLHDRQSIGAIQELTRCFLEAYGDDEERM